ncbi:hypothetical protein BHE74_00045639 [Ensete ventricosum]|nr:hypothetical protein BHE74_00045639 [Ensete ventricosum]RZR99856.1 hypothetical protein BHM03_00029476 [Ensete ventricosum]
MSSASSHSESLSVKISAHRSRVLSRPFGDSVSVAVIPSSGVGVLDDFGTANALVAMWSFFDVDSTMTTHRLVESINRCSRGGSKIPTASRNRGVPRRVEDFSFPDGAQLVAVSSGFLVGVLWVGYSGDPRVVHGLLPAKSGASRVLLGHS